jgi:hypothetical protein
LGISLLVDRLALALVAWLPDCRVASWRSELTFSVFPHTLAEFEDMAIGRFGNSEKSLHAGLGC